jgi:hypothetical protein
MPGSMRHDDFDSASLVHFALLHFMRLMMETSLWIASIRWLA